MALKDQITAFGQQMAGEFLAGLRGQRPSAQESADIAWACDQIAKHYALSQFGGQPDQSVIDQSAAEAYAILKDYAAAHAIDGQALVRTTVLKVIGKATDFAFAAALRAATGGVL